MLPRDTKEAHRAATPLELFFDLVFVIAIAAAAAGLHHSVAEAHFVDGIIKYVAIFFAIWWAWMNYTWFASAYDNDDSLFRILTLVIIAGALTLAAGVSHFFTSSDLTLVVVGFVIMRIAMVGFWLRAYKHDVTRKQTGGMP
jgi:low temperature requirement protein LtrA